SRLSGLSGAFPRRMANHSYTKFRADVGLLTRPSLDVVGLVSLVCGLAVVFGWPLGYRDITSYVTFWMGGILVGLSSVQIERLGFASVDRADRLIRLMVIAFTIVALCGLSLGSAGWLGRAPYLLFFALCFAISRIGRMSFDSHEPADEPAS